MGREEAAEAGEDGNERVKVVNQVRRMRKNNGKQLSEQKKLTKEWPSCRTDSRTHSLA